MLMYIYIQLCNCWLQLYIVIQPLADIYKMYMNALDVQKQLHCANVSLHINVFVSLVVSHSGAYPAVVATNTSEDAGVSLHGALVTPGHNSLQLTTAHQGATGISLQA